MSSNEHPSMAKCPICQRDLPEADIIVASRETSDRAGALFTLAKKTDAYADYLRAVSTFEQACRLWRDNVEANAGVSQAKLALAQACLLHCDFELGLATADPDNQAHFDVIRKLQAGKADRDFCVRRAFARNKALLVALVVGLVVSIAFAGYSFRKMRDLDHKAAAHSLHEPASRHSSSH